MISLGSMVSHAPEPIPHSSSTASTNSSETSPSLCSCVSWCPWHSAHADEPSRVVNGRYLCGRVRVINHLITRRCTGAADNADLEIEIVHGGHVNAVVMLLDGSTAEPMPRDRRIRSSQCRTLNNTHDATSQCRGSTVIRPDTAIPMARHHKTGTAT